MVMTKSGKIRRLYDLGLDIKEISVILEIRYQHAYNVVSQYLVQKEKEVQKGVDKSTITCNSTLASEEEDKQEEVCNEGTFMEGEEKKAKM